MFSSTKVRGISGAKRVLHVVKVILLETEKYYENVEPTYEKNLYLYMEYLIDFWKFLEDIVTRLVNSCLSCRSYSIRRFTFVSYQWKELAKGFCFSHTVVSYWFTSCRGSWYSWFFHHFFPVSGSLCLLVNFDFNLVLAFIYLVWYLNCIWFQLTISGEFCAFLAESIWISSLWPLLNPSC